MTRHYPDLGSDSEWLKKISHSALPIRSTNQIWMVTRHQYGISAPVSQTSFRGGNYGGVAQCRLFSHAQHACWRNMTLCPTFEHLSDRWP